MPENIGSLVVSVITGIFSTLALLLNLRSQWRLRAVDTDDKREEREAKERAELIAGMTTQQKQWITFQEAQLAGCHTRIAALEAECERERAERRAAQQRSDATLRAQRLHGDALARLVQVARDAADGERAAANARPGDIRPPFYWPPVPPEPAPT